MLPFLKPKRAAEAIISHRVKTPETPIEHKESEEHPELVQHAQSMIDGVHAKDPQAVAAAMRAAHGHLNPKAPDASDKK